MADRKRCPNCNGAEFAEGSDFMHVKRLDKKFSGGSNKIYTFCVDCGEVVSTRIEMPEKFRK